MIRSTNLTVSSPSFCFPHVLKTCRSQFFSVSNMDWIFLFAGKVTQQVAHHLLTAGYRLISLECKANLVTGSQSESESALISIPRNKVTIDAEAKTIKAGGGSLWRDVDREAEKYELAAVGGTINRK